MKSILVIIIAILFVVTACTTEVTTDPPETLKTANLLGLRINDASGNDLLSEKTPGYYSYNDLDYMVETKKKMQVYYNIRQDIPKNISIEKVEGEYCLGVYLLAPADGETISNTYIRFGGVDIDTIRAEFEKVPENPIQPFALNEVWYNGKLLDEYKRKLGFSVIIKQPKK